MKLRSWKFALFGTWLLALPVVALIDLRRGDARTALNARSGPWGPTASSGCVTLYGPDVEGEKRLEAKQRIVGQLLAGRTSLLVAAAAFRSLDERGSSRWVRASQRFPDAASDEEAYCRSVLMFLRATNPIEVSEEAADRLEAELNAKVSGTRPNTTASRR